MKTTKAVLNLMLILLVAALLAPISRVLNTSINNVEEDIPKMAPTAIDHQLSTWLKPLGQMRATNQGAYYVKGYQAKQCDGSIALLGLYKNAEAAHILSTLVPNADQQGYIFKQSIHPTFPQLGYALERVKQKIRQLLTLQREPIHALAFAEFGQCQLAQLIAKKIP